MALKRNRSTNTSKAYPTSEPVSKLSRLKSGLNIFSKISDAMTQRQQDNQLYNYTKQTSFVGILQYFRIDQSCPRRRTPTSDIDGQHKYYQYHQYHQKSNRKQTGAQQEERHIHTMPTTQAKTLTGILIKQRSGLSQPPQQQKYNPHHQLSLTKSITQRSAKTHVSASNMTINSEDLTAKEFANIAGIRIVSDDDEEEQEKYDDDPDDLIGTEQKFDTGASTDEDFLHMHTVSTTTSKSYFNYHDLDEHDCRLSVISYASMQSYATTHSKPKIWDNEFWLNPEEHPYQQQSQSNSTATYRPVNTVSPKKRLDRPIWHQLRTDKKVAQTSHYVIKKGRFECHIGDCHPTSGASLSALPTPTASDIIISSNNSSQQTTNEGVLEWKRKRKD